MTLGVLEEALVDFPGCALVVSHDRWFLNRVATRILAFEGDGKVVLYEGDYDTYLALRPPPAEAPKKAPKVAAGPRPASAPSGPKKLSYKERAELEGMEAAIETAEAKVAELDGLLADPGFYRARAADAPRVTSELAEARVVVERLYARWEELEGRR